MMNKPKSAFPPRITVVASFHQLRDGPYSLRLWWAAKNLRISSYAWLDVMEETFRLYDGVVFSDDGAEWPIPDVDVTFGGDRRWISMYLESEDGLPRRIPKRLDRVQLIDLCIRIKYPDIARGISRSNVVQ